MDVQVVLGVLGLAAATFSTLWATGGWSALRRRSIQQELDLAKELPESSPARKLLTTHVEDEIEIYLYRVREQQPQPIGRPLGRVGLGFTVLAAIALIFPDANMVVVVVVEGLFIAVLVWAYAEIMRSWWIKRSRRRHDDLLKQARNEQARKAADVPAAAKGQQVELA
jgi:hypothetical protein